LTEKVEDELRKLSVEIRILEEAAEALQARINVINAALTDLNYASRTLEGLEREKENAELFIPIGGSSYIKARLERPDKIVVGIGAGVSVEKTLQEAKEIVRKRIEELEKNRISLQQQLSQVVNKINEDRGRLEELIATLRKETQAKNV
jgi:prefoldin alpha subunit